MKEKSEENFTISFQWLKALVHVLSPENPSSHKKCVKSDQLLAKHEHPMDSVHWTPGQIDGKEKLREGQDHCESRLHSYAPVNFPSLFLTFIVPSVFSHSIRAPTFFSLSFFPFNSAFFWTTKRISFHRLFSLFQVLALFKVWNCRSPLQLSSPSLSSNSSFSSPWADGQTSSVRLQTPQLQWFLNFGRAWAETFSRTS